MKKIINPIKDTIKVVFKGKEEVLEADSSRNVSDDLANFLTRIYGFLRVERVDEVDLSSLDQETPERGSESQETASEDEDKPEEGELSPEDDTVDAKEDSTATKKATKKSTK